MNIADMIREPARVSAVSLQRTPAWYQARIGKLTASRMADAMEFRKDGKEGAARKKLRTEIVAERMTDIIIEHYVTPAMLWGIETEPQAKEFAVENLGLNIVECGFFDHPDIEYFGASPDGLVGDDGLIEIKCPTTTTHIDWVIADVVPEEYKPQMLAQLLCTGRKYCEFLSFDPRIPKRQYFLKRFEPTAEELANVRVSAIQFLLEVDTLFEKVTAGS
jgi:exodeoxyribonuclease (lambda-induced)